MFEQKYPQFIKGRILKIEMLEALRDFPRNMIEVAMKDYTNGIVSGCEIHVNEDYLVIESGVIRCEKVFYVLNQAYKIPYTRNKHLTLLKVKCTGDDTEDDFIRYTTQIYLSEEETCHPNEVELCRFNLKEGARLRAEYTNFEDMSTTYDTVNRIYAKASGSGQSTLLPHIMKQYAIELLGYRPKEAIDISFCLMVLQSEGYISNQSIMAYLGYKDISIHDERGNEIIYTKLNQILKEISKGGGDKYDRKGFSRGILLD